MGLDGLEWAGKWLGFMVVELGFVIFGLRFVIAGLGFEIWGCPPQCGTACSRGLPVRAPRPLLVKFGPVLEYGDEFQMTFSCHFHFESFPFDRHECKMDFGDAMYGIRKVTLNPAIIYHHNNTISMFYKHQPFEVTS